MMKFNLATDASVYELSPQYVGRPSNQLDLTRAVKLELMNHRAIILRAGGTS